jgi:hypothetical protein
VQAGGGNCTTIQACVDLVPTTLDGNYCLDIQDSATYNEAVVIRNKFHTAAGYRINIGPLSAQTPVVTPPNGATAGFRVLTDSVTISGVQILITDTAGFGIDIASSSVIVDNVLISDPGNNVGGYGVRISSNANIIRHSTISLVSAYGVGIDWGFYNLISYTSITVVNGTGVKFDAGAYAGGSNTFTNGFIQGSAGVDIGGGNQFSSDNNTVSYSTITATSSGVRIINNSRKIVGNVLDHLHLQGAIGVNLAANAVSNTVTHSTVVATNPGAYAFYLNGASSNTVSYNFIYHDSGYSLRMFEAGYNLIEFSTVVSNNSGYSASMYYSSFNVLSNCHITGAPFYVDDSAFANTLQYSTVAYDSFSTPSMQLRGSSNTVRQVLITNPAGQAMDLTGAGNSIILSSMTGRTVAFGGVSAVDSGILAVRGASTTITSSFFQNNSQHGLLVLSSYNTISGSTIIAYGVGNFPGFGGVYVTGSDNTFSDSWIDNREDNGNYGMRIGGSRNSIVRSTVTAESSYGIYFNAVASNTVYGSYVEGLTAAAYIFKSTGTVINSSVLAAKTAASDGLRLTAGSVNVTVSSTVVMGGAQAAGVYFAENETGGVLTVSSVAIQGSIEGLHIDTQAANSIFFMSSVTFQNMPTQSTAVYFGGGTFVLGFSYFNFLSNNLLVNIDASRLNAGSSIGLSDASGPKSGAGFELDPGNFVDWSAIPGSPGTPVATALGISSVSWTWGAAPNAASYKIYLATDTVAQYAAVAGPPFIVTGQSTNTALGIVILASNSNGNGPLSAAATAYTLAAPATAFALVKVNLSSITVQWAANTNPAGTTTYRVDWWAAGSTTSVTTSITSTVVNGLNPDTSYYLTVSAINGNAIVSAPSVVLATCTPTLPVAGTPSGTALGVSSISWTWSQAPSATSYRIYEASTTVLLGTVAAPPFSYVNRSTNTAYGVVVAAVSANGIGPLSAAATTYTLAAIPTGLAFQNVWISSVALQWASAGNPAGTTTYRVDWWGIVGATTSFTTTLTSASITGLNQGTSYYAAVSAINGDGFISSPTAVVSTRTQLSPFVTGLTGTALGVSSITWTWGAVPGATSYNIYLATEPTTQIGSVAAAPFSETGLSTNTANGIVVAVVDGLGTGPLSPAATAYTLAAPATSFAVAQIYYSSITVQWAPNGNPAGTTTYRVDRWAASGATTSITVSLTSAAITALNPGTTYYMRVSPINAVGLISTSNVIISALTGDLPVSGAPVGTALGVSSISWTWSTPAGAASYNIYLATKPTSLVASVVAPPLIYLNGSTNTAYGIRVAAVDSNGIGPLSAAATTYTLAAAPENISIAQVTVTTITVSWAAVGNPAGTTTYRVDRWAATGATTSVTVSVASAVIGGLTQGTFYYFSVSAFNALGVQAPAGAVVSTRTLTLPVAGTPVGSALGVSSISWTWSAAAGASSYKVYLASDGVTLIGAVAAPPFVDTALSTNTARAIVVSPIDSSGGIGILSPSATTYTRAAPPTVFSLVQVDLSSITVQWSANTNPTGTTTYRLDRWAATGATASITTSITSATLSGLELDTTYFLKLTAFNGGGLASAAVELSTLTRGYGQSIGGIVVGGSSVAFVAPSGPILLRVPPGAFNQSVNVILSVPASFPAPAPGPAALVGTGVGVQVLLDKSLQPLTYVTLTVGYRDQDVAGMSASRLILARYDEDRRTWVPLVSVVDSSTRSVTAQTNHFSVFQIMQTAAVEDISAIKAFPNPLMPARGHSLMTFAQLPANARLRIYDVRGSLVNELTADGSGMVQWNGNNRDGMPASSGVYFVYAQGAGAQRTVKVAIQR